MSKLIAILALFVASITIAYFNMTITWGLIVQSWPAFFGFWFLGIINFFLIQAVGKDE